MSCIYFLAKEEIPHITKYKPLLELPSHLGLPFLETLYKGNNATSTSHHIIEEFLSILADSVKSDLIANYKSHHAMASFVMKRQICQQLSNFLRYMPLL